MSNVVKRLTGEESLRIPVAVASTRLRWIHSSPGARAIPMHVAVCVAVCRSVLQSSYMLQCTRLRWIHSSPGARAIPMHVAVCYSVNCSVCCSVSQCVAVNLHVAVHAPQMNTFISFSKRPISMDSDQYMYKFIQWIGTLFISASDE